MIKSTIELVYDARKGEKKAVIQMEITSWITNHAGITYTVNDYAISANGSKQLINTKDVFYSVDQVDQMDLLISSTIDFAGMSKTEIEWLKLKKALLYVTKQLPVYGSAPENWISI